MKINTDELKVAVRFWLFFLFIAAGCFLAAWFFDGLREILIGWGIVSLILFIVSFVLLWWNRVLD